MNKYIFIVASLVLIYLGQPRRSSDPLGALVITGAIGAILLVVALILDFVFKPIRQRMRRRHFPNICLAAADGDATRVRSLVVSGDSPNAQGPSGETPLMLAARNGHLEAVEVLLELGADPSACTPKGSTAQAIALRSGHKNIAERLRIARE